MCENIKYIYITALYTSMALWRYIFWSLGSERVSEVIRIFKRSRLDRYRYINDWQVYCVIDTANLHDWKSTIISKKKKKVVKITVFITRM